MSRIDIRRRHGTTLKKAKASAQAIADELAQEFEIDYEWDGNVLTFQRPGVDGTITVDKEAVHVQASLGLLVGMLKGRIEREVHRYCDEQFGADD